jgi:MerR family transcriptional regulator, light-induced transcriptional regulator
MDMGGYLRIGELAKRTGLSPDVLRAWERRYGVLRPERTPGGFRLYTGADEARVRRMKALIDEGLSTSEAAGLAEGEEVAAAAGEWAGPGLLHDLGARLEVALDAYEEAEAHDAFDALLAAFATETVLREVVVPYLHRVGERWEGGELTVAQEHFASGFVRGRLLGLARGWGRGRGPRALLACPPGELHDLGLLVFGIALADRGWRISYLGPDTPVDTLSEAVRTLHPELVVLAAADPHRFLDVAGPIAEVADLAPVVIGGAGADREVADRLGVRWLEGDPVSAASAA